MEIESLPMIDSHNFQTLIPNSPSFPSNFEPTASLRHHTTMADNHHRQKRQSQGSVTDKLIIDLNELPSTSSNCSKIRSQNDKIVIDLLDDYDDDDDHDCVFVKKGKNLSPLGSHKLNPICIDDNFDESDKFSVDIVDNSNYSSRILGKRKKPFSGISIMEIGECSGSKADEIEKEVNEIDPSEMMFVCEICADSRPRKESFQIKGCCHSYCSGCIQNYVASKLQDGVYRIDCPVPSCSGVLEPEYCREILPFEVFVRWGNLLCESVIHASQKFYCPFKDCSALLIDDGSEKVTISECPACNRLFCAQCKVGWHHGIGCTEYQSLSKDERAKEDILLRNLAKSKKWQRCPKCKIYVEKSQGCRLMYCRCGTTFCYCCGERACIKFKQQLQLLGLKRFGVYNKFT